MFFIFTGDSIVIQLEEANRNDFKNVLEASSQLTGHFKAVVIEAQRAYGALIRFAKTCGDREKNELIAAVRRTQLQCKDASSLDLSPFDVIKDTIEFFVSMTKETDERNKEGNAIISKAAKFKFSNANSVKWAETWFEFLECIRNIFAKYEKEWFYAELPTGIPAATSKNECDFEDCKSNFATVDDLNKHKHIVHGLTKGFRCGCGNLFSCEYFSKKCCETKN